jgi:RNA polymerase sigma-70 factor (ECF subfamily)
MTFEKLIFADYLLIRYDKGEFLMYHLMDERQLVKQLKGGDQSSFQELYAAYAPKLFAFSRKYLSSREDAEEIVQEVFIRIWEKKENIDAAQSFSSYVIQAAKHRIFNGFRKKVNEQAYLDFLIYSDKSSKNFTQLDVEYRDVKNKAEEAIACMPPKRQEIFRLSRETGLKNKEIAEKLQISIKTVENQMGQALKFLRNELKDYQSLILIFLLAQL